MPSNKPHKWKFLPKFRSRSFGIEGSRKAHQRVKEAVSEIQRVAKRDPALGGEGAVLFLERLGAATEMVKGSAATLSTAMYNAVQEVIPIIIAAPVSEDIRLEWLDRLWTPMVEDDRETLHALEQRWGEICKSKEIAEVWADRLGGMLKEISSGKQFISGHEACLSCTLRAGRFDELLKTLARMNHKSWDYRRLGAMAMAEQGDVDGAIDYALTSDDDFEGELSKAKFCENALIAAGRAEEAFKRFAYDANESNTHLNTFRAIARKYPQKPAETILRHLIARNPKQAGKWFATARNLKLLDLAADLAWCNPAEPLALNKAAKAHQESDPGFCYIVAMAALYWMSLGRYYRIDSFDVTDSLRLAWTSSRKIGKEEEFERKVADLANGTVLSEDFTRDEVRKWLERDRSER